MKVRYLYAIIDCQWNTIRDIFVTRKECEAKKFCPKCKIAMVKNVEFKVIK